ncbi:serine/threonine-protein kinase [Nocardia cyriacigeorgica]|uniref:non-specific serine/threonine protein kinase n=1 Tax=Nocardia cyriacigeorgica (strain GUH-2) TaxID=1127134 RepID=H6RC35_NOCCG|nr:serine/threonine-protein kinase [Nocardia cyriacigeorgica]CCF62571.1 Serine/threonine protein kinase [Nocardia cyriacigeorgica GUH-2]
MKPQVVGDRYELIGEIGSGGMGQVYEGFDRHLKRRIAVKFTQQGLNADPDWTKRFFREAELMARLHHPGLPTIHDAGSVPDSPERPYLVMEFIEGVTFGELLARRGPLPVGVVATLGAQVAAVLAAAHRHRIYHRDLKPSNLMLCADGTVKVLDFGLAVALDADMSRYTSTGHTLGTPAFMAPEQVEGRSVVPQTDLYALGLVLHELLTGDRVMTGSTPYALWQNQVHLPSPEIQEICPDVPDDMARLIMSMLAKSPDQRPEDAATVHSVLLRHAIDLGALPEINDLRGPALMYAKAVGVTGSPAVSAPDAVRAPVVSEPDDAPEGDAVTVEFSRGDLQRAVERAGDLADDSRYDPALRQLESAVERAATLFGSRDADVVEARLRLAQLRFETENYAGAAEVYRHLVDDIGAERGPYDDQVMFCQRSLAICEVRNGDVDAAIARLRHLHSQMAVRYGEQDRRVIELAALIRSIEGP